jgi:tape measure domain-containing protein
VANSIAKLAILLTTDASGVSKGFAQARAQVQGFQQSLRSGDAGGGIGGMLGLGGVNPWAIAGAGAAALATWATRIAENAKTAAINFGVMMGSAKEAQNLLGGIKDFALASPFSEGQLQSSAQVLLAFGMAGEKVVPTLKTLGDIALGDAAKMDRLTLAFAQMQAAGKLTGQDLLQMVNAGFNPLQEIARITGRDMNDLRLAMSDGAISAQMVALAFKAATEEGGRFHEAIKAQQGTLSGQWNMFVENIGQSLKPVGSAIGDSIRIPLAGWNMLFNYMRTGSFDVAENVKKIGDNAESAAEKLARMAGQIKTAGDNLKGWDTEGFAGSLERFDKLQKSLGEQGANFAAKFRTPLEDFAAAVAEAEKLFQSQAISAEVYQRAIAKAKDDLAQSSKSAKDITAALTPGTAATSRFSQQGRSNVLAFERNFAAMQQLERDQLHAQEQANGILERIKDAVENNEPVKIEEHSL